VLSRIYRQAEGSGITQIAHYINQGHVPTPADYSKECVFIEQQDIAEAAKRVVKIMLWLKGQGKTAMVLSPMKKGEAGTGKLNELLQEALNPIPEDIPDEEYQLVRGFQKFRINDRVMQLKNNYDEDKMVFNGDSGVIASIDREEHLLGVDFEGRGIVLYDFIDLDQLTLSYASTVHKAQGSEAECVIFLVLTQHFVMLARNLAYTAVSRAKKQAVIIGSQKAMSIAVRNDKPKARYTRLKELLAGR
jgi:exodeoxyribonuclease V alpha subunit